MTPSRTRALELLQRQFDKIDACLGAAIEVQQHNSKPFDSLFFDPAFGTPKCQVWTPDGYRPTTAVVHTVTNSWKAPTPPEHHFWAMIGLYARSGDRASTLAAYLQTKPLLGTL